MKLKSVTTTSSVLYADKNKLISRHSRPYSRTTR